MRVVKGIYARKAENGAYEKCNFDVGFFHAWGSETTEYETGGCTDTVAIVELPDGKIVKTMPENIQFLHKSANNVMSVCDMQGDKSYYCPHCHGPLYKYSETPYECPRCHNYLIWND